MKTELKYGLIIALASTALLIIQDLAGLYDEHIAYLSTVSWAGYIIPIVGLFFAIKEKRDKDLQGFISYGKCVSTGIVTSLVSGVLMTIVQFLFISFVNTNFAKHLLELQEQKMFEQGLPPEQVDAAMGMVQFMLTPFMLSMMAFIGSIVGGIIISLIVGAILKKSPTTEFE